MRKVLFVISWAILSSAFALSTCGFANEDEYDFEQPLDHFTGGGPTFQQRIFVDTDYAPNPASAPILYVLCGESRCRGRPEPGYEQLAKAQRAVVIKVEHRFYGGSGFPRQSSNQNLQYLTTEQAIADAVDAQAFLKKKLGLSGPWVTAGCSYAGALASFLRVSHPELIVGSIASGAPVEARLEAPEFEAAISLTLGKSCTAKAGEAMTDLDSIFLQGSSEEKAHWLGRLGYKSTQDPEAILSYASSEAAAAVQYGYSQQFCDALAGAPNALDGFVDFVRTARHSGISVNVESFGAWSLLRSENLPPIWQDSRAWNYQACHEFGFFTPTNIGCDFSVFSRHNGSIGDFQKFCGEAFSISAGERIHETNLKYFEKIKSQGSNMLFFTGSNDPWRIFSIRPDNNPNARIQAATVENGSHCSELVHENLEARKKMSQAFQEWTKPSL